MVIHIFNVLKKFMCMGVLVCLHICLGTAFLPGIYRCKKRVLAPLALKLQMFVTWVLGFRSRSSERVARALSLWTISPSTIFEFWIALLWHFHNNLFLLILSHCSSLSPPPPVVPFQLSWCMCPLDLFFLTTSSTLLVLFLDP